MFEIIWLGLGLAMDAFAVSIAGGAINPNLGKKTVMKMACIFGAFQGAMPLIGFAATAIFKGKMEMLGHWIASGLLMLIGLKMLWEATRKKKTSSIDLEKNIILLTLAVATSIDAMAAGFTFPFLEVTAMTAVIVISIITTLLCSIGPKIGQLFGRLLHQKAEVFGALLLIALGTRMLFEHTNRWV